jgi:enolase-phosphatase E1
MDRDRKSPALKLLQGHIWERGYRDGQLRGSVFADVVPAIRRWRDAGCDVAIYSSGSVLAQRLLFASTAEGDLTPLFRAFFDTGAGSKTSPASYTHIVAALECGAADVLFISDVTTELAAARTADLQVVLSLRPGNPMQQDAAAFEAIRSFDEVEPRP